MKKSDIEYVGKWQIGAPAQEINFRPARVLLQDFTGVPCVVDFAAMRDALRGMGADPKRANPLIPADLVIDHSVQVDKFGSQRRLQRQCAARIPAQPGALRFSALGPKSVSEFPRRAARHRHRAPGESRISGPGGFHRPDAKAWPYPDTLMGTDSHTTMINGLGVVGWGVGGIEAEACMLGQPISMLLPEVVGFRLKGRLPEGATATDLVLTVTQMLRKKGVVGKFVEFYGPGVAALPLADRATIGNMAPEYGATIGFFPIDHKTLDYLRLTNRPPEQIALVEAYAKEQGLFLTENSPEPEYSDTLELDLGTVVPSLAGPKRPQDRIDLPDVKKNFLAHSRRPAAHGRGADQRLEVHHPGRLGGHRRHHQLHQHVESLGDGRRRIAREEGRRKRPAHQAVGEDQPRAGIESGHRLPQRSRPDCRIWKS